MTRPVSVGVNLTSGAATTIYTVPLGYFAKWNLMYILITQDLPRVFLPTGETLAHPLTSTFKTVLSLLALTFAWMEELMWYWRKVILW